MTQRIPTDPLTEADHAWVNGQPRPAIGEIVDEMNKRYASYKNFSSMTEKQIDKQVRQDFRNFGSQDKSIILTDGVFLPYKREESHGKKPQTSH